MLTQTVAGRVYDYSHSIGRGGTSGNSFLEPNKLSIGRGDAVYVLSRGMEGIPGGPPLMPNNYGGRVTKVTIGTEPSDEEFLAEFCETGSAEGHAIWPAGLALDSQENVYVTDEWLNRVSIFDKDGNFLSQWGSSGEGDGEFNRPSGIAIDHEDTLYIVDSLNHRVQVFTKDGRYMAKWGSLGSGKGELNSPWGITLDRDGNVYVADHKNHRVQKFSREGELLAQFGSYGTGPGELNRPADVAVDPEGDVYVCDWANNRVQVFGPDEKFITSLIGDAQELSKWARWTVDANADVIKARRRVKSLEPEWRLNLPQGVSFDAEKSRLIVADTSRSRLQIYNKLHDYVEPQFNL